MTSTPETAPPPGRPRALLVYVLATLGAAVPAAALAAAAIVMTPPDTGGAVGALVFLAAALVSELHPVKLDDRGERSVSLALTFILAALLLFGWPFAVLTAMLSTLTAQIVERTPRLRLALNTSSYGLGAAAAGLVAHAGGGQAALHGPNFERLTLLAFICGASFLVVNVGSVACAVSLATGMRARALVEGWMRDSGFAFTIMAFIAALAISLWIVHPPLELLLGGPLFALALYQRYAWRSVVARRDADTDALTGLGNHRSFHAHLGQALAEAAESSGTLALCMVDIDGFKSINDRFGHPVGDEVLERLAALIVEEAPEAGAYRVGGEEFALLLPGAGEKEAQRALERVHERLWRTSFAHGEPVTVSAGIAVYPTRAEERDELLRLADGALYWAKNHGKNRTCVYSPEVVRILTTEELAADAEHQARLRAAEGLIRVVDANDTYAGAHSQSVARLVEGIARELGLDRPTVEQMRLAGLLHDLGKIAIPDRILQKPGRLDAEELSVMREHAELGYRLVEGLGVSPVDRWIRHHHEWWDGSGYPAALAGDAIPLGARVIAVADAFDAMTSDRCYRAADSLESAVAELRRRSWSQFDGRIVAALERHLAAAGAHRGRAAA